MAGLLRLAIVLTVFYTFSDAYILPRMFPGRSKDGVSGELLKKISPEVRRLALAKSTKGWFDQKLDHFNSADSRRWKQKFYTDGTSKSKYIFVNIGGEGSADPTWITDSAMATWAKKYNASCMQLEHRFYGDSHPTSDASTENLRYLSSEQALADLAAFISAKKEEFEAEKVIVFGGSYPGALAAWFRLKYPHLADAAVASSAIVLTGVGFPGFYESVYESLNTYKTGNVCTIAIADAVTKLQSLMGSEEGRAQVKKMFDWCHDIENEKEDVSNMYAQMAYSFAGAAQYNSSEGGINTVCKSMTDTSVGEPIKRYAQVNSDAIWGECFDFSYDTEIENLKKADWESAGYGRTWIYQSCNELGDFQTSGSDKQPFGHEFPLEFWTQWCVDLFGPQYTIGNITRAINDTNINYGGLDFAQSRVVFVNGGTDPWHQHSILKSKPNAPAIFIPGESHCADMYAPKARDHPGIVKAHKEIEQFIDQWLQAPAFELN